ncbi:MAG: hypothetical protein HOD64_06825 [Candidatus Cloacimonetes bacterium]|jgi:hypothetical protein|nr:hypothetical protein [Candidatus Cloacimonadota bacterium]MBT4332974.1 hypothetical protein [Candidatus Cloacimonadota bacterium]MBT4575780.1 hypothetical protein [Candidatus Cloacimonadota bacterium]
MGTQQILLIVLSVIIVGIAVAVGITMFNAQATNSNRQAIVGDMNNLAASALAFYKTPATHGGGDNDWGATADDPDELGTWLGYEWDGTICATGNGEYTITIAGDVVTIVGVGNELGNDGAAGVQATMLITGQTSAIGTTIDN